MLSFNTTIHGYPAIATVEGEGTRIVTILSVEYEVNGITLYADIDALEFNHAEYDRILSDMPEDEDNSPYNQLLNKADNDYKESRS